MAPGPRRAATARFSSSLAPARPLPGHGGRVRRTLLLVATWAAGTVLAVVVAWWAVGRVSSEVVDRPAAPISDGDVAVALGADPAGASGTTTTSTPAGGGGAPSTATPGASTVPSVPGPGATTPTVPGGSAPRTTLATPATTTPATSPSTTAPSGTGAPATTATIDSVGGQVAVRYDAGRVELLWARPEPGFEAEVHSDGPDTVEVRFESDRHESRVRAFFTDGAPDREVREAGESGG